MFAEKSRYGRIIHQVTHKGGEAAMNYIKILQNTQASSVSVGNSYYEYQFMHIILDIFHQGRKYSAQIANHQAELRREESINDQKYLSVSSTHTEYLNIDSTSGPCKNSESAHLVQTKCTFCQGANHL